MKYLFAERIQEGMLTTIARYIIYRMVPNAQFTGDGEYMYLTLLDNMGETYITNSHFVPPNIAVKAVLYKMDLKKLMTDYSLITSYYEVVHEKDGTSRPLIKFLCTIANANQVTAYDRMLLPLSAVDSGLLIKDTEWYLEDTNAVMLLQYNNYVDQCSRGFKTFHPCTKGEELHHYCVKDNDTRILILSRQGAVHLFTEDTMCLISNSNDCEVRTTKKSLKTVLLNAIKDAHFASKVVVITSVCKAVRIYPQVRDVLKSEQQALITNAVLQRMDISDLCNIGVISDNIVAGDYMNLFASLTRLLALCNINNISYVIIDDFYSGKSMLPADTAAMLIHKVIKMYKNCFDVIVLNSTDKETYTCYHTIQQQRSEDEHEYNNV